MLYNQKGFGNFKVYLFFAFLFLVVHAGLKIIPMYMDYSRMEDVMTAKASFAQVLKDEDILRDLTNKAKDLDLPLTAESFILRRDEDRRKMAISTRNGWDVELIFLWGAYTRNFHFAPSVEESFLTVTL
jgi:hypothetical protein